LHQGQEHEEGKGKGNGNKTNTKRDYINYLINENDMKDKDANDID